jgi:RNA polymerase-binding transcription factor DksA
VKNLLSPWQTTKLKSDLRRRFEALRETVHQHLLKSDEERARLFADRAGDLEDQSVTELLIDVDRAEISREFDELRDIEEALARLRRQTYAVCLSCNTPIPYDRLAAYPTAKRCLRCQAAYEDAHGSRMGR